MSSLLVSLALLLLLGAAAPVGRSQSADPGWPRVYARDGRQLTVYQPQVDYWHGFTNLHFRSAIAVKGVLNRETFGVAEVDALTVADQAARVVAIVPLKRELRFAGVQEPDLTRLRQAAEELRPMGEVTTLSMDRLIAYLEPAAHAGQPPVEVNLDPPRIFGSTAPAILVIFMGEPRFQPVETNRADLHFALNTNWDVLYDTASRQYYLLNGQGWLTTPDLRNGPWMPTQALPPSLYALPNNDNWADARKALPGTASRTAPTVFVSTEPAELIVTDGPPAFAPVRGTRLMRVTNTQSTLFLHTGDGKLYFLVAGRWFRGSGLGGPWTAASRDLPADFAQIPGDDPAAWVKASVPGTREAGDAILLASIPTTTTVAITNTLEVRVVYSGPPQFVTITNTVVQYAANTPSQVFLVNGRYYWCDRGVWLESSAPAGPWAFCIAVPPAIYTIPPSNPNYNVTYVVVQSTSPSTVTYSQTAGYSGEYVAATGVLMFGMGMLVGAAIADHDHYYYYPPPPCLYSYGCAATYHYGYGGYYGAGYAAYGPYGGAGHAAAYNPSTGTYARSSYAYGPYGSAARSAAYNPYTGSYAAAGQVNTPYGSAGGYRSYNASTGQYSAGGYRSGAYGSTSSQLNYNAATGQGSASRQVNTAYGSASRGAAYDAQTGARAAGGQIETASGSAGRAAAYNPSTGQGAAARAASGQYASAGTVTTTGGGSAAAWSTQQGQGAVGKSGSGDVYASNGDTAYKKDSDGSWYKNTGNGWESTESPKQQAQAQATSRQPQAQTQTGAYQQQAQARASSASSSWDQERSSMESQAQSRSWGNQQHERAQSWQSSGGGRSWSGGGGRRR